MFDINTLAIAATANVPVCNAAGVPQFDAEGNALSITLYGPGTKQYQEARHLAEERNTDRAFAKAQGKIDGKMTLEEKLAMRAELLASCTHSFNHFGNGDLTGRDLYLAVYNNPALGHIAESCDRFLAERANFLLQPASN